MPYKDLMQDPAPRLAVTGCPQCGHIARVGNRVFCRHCHGEGHLYRMMMAAELVQSAERNARAGYSSVAQRRRGVAVAVRSWTDKTD